MATAVFLCDISERKTAERAMDRRLEFERAISSVSFRFVSTRNIDKAITASLNEMGKLTGAQRAFTYAIRKDGVTLRKTHDWYKREAAPLTEKPQIVSRENLPWLQGSIDNNVLSIPEFFTIRRDVRNKDALPEGHGISSLLIIPVFVGGNFGGFIGLEGNFSVAPWSDDDINALRVMGEIIGNALDRKHVRDTENEIRTLQETDKLRRQLLANVTHELRTPLTMVKGYATLLSDNDLDLDMADKRRHLTSIVKSSDQLMELVDDLLDMSQLESGMLSLEKYPSNLSDIVKEVVDEARMRKPADFIEFKLSKTLSKIDLDPKRIKQVLTNLVNNATQYSPVGTKVIISSRHYRNNVRVAVTDNGPGIPSKEFPKVFRPLYRVPGKHGKSRGTGLGLSIVKGLVEAHGGKIWIESQKGEGTKCTFTIPLSNNHQ